MAFTQPAVVHTLRGVLRGVRQPFQCWKYYISRDYRPEATAANCQVSPKS
jgi:hypothetical protein